MTRPAVDADVVDSRHTRERTRGPWRLLAIPRIYTWFQKQLAVADGRAQVAAFIGAHAEDTVLDVGCGPADILPFLPPVKYVGLDVNSSYLADARRRHPSAEFLEMDIRALPQDWSNRFDLVLAQGVFHHFNDEQATAMLTDIARTMAPRGRLITVDPAFAKGQHVIARMMCRLDRGRHVRTIAQYEQLAHRVFAHVNLSVRHNLMRIPYTHVLMECARRRG